MENCQVGSRSNSRQQNLAPRTSCWTNVWALSPHLKPPLALSSSNGFHVVLTPFCFVTGHRSWHWLCHGHPPGGAFSSDKKTLTFKETHNMEGTESVITICSCFLQLSTFPALICAYIDSYLLFQV